MKIRDSCWSLLLSWGVREKSGFLIYWFLAEAEGMKMRPVYIVIMTYSTHAQLHSMTIIHRQIQSLQRHISDARSHNQAKIRVYRCTRKRPRCLWRKSLQRHKIRGEIEVWQLYCIPRAVLFSCRGLPCSAEAGIKELRMLIPFASTSWSSVASFFHNSMHLNTIDLSKFTRRLSIENSLFADDAGTCCS